MAATAPVVLTTGLSRLDPRRAAVGLRRHDVCEAVLRDNEQAVAECRSMARTLGLSIEGVVEWEPCGPG